MLLGATQGALLAGATQAEPPKPDAPSRAARWTADLDFLLGELPRRHANLYHSISQAELGTYAVSLREAAARLTDVQMMIAIARFIARIGDGHTGYFLPWDRANGFRRYPIELWIGKDGPIVIAAAAPYASLVGARLTRIGGRQPVDLMESIKPLLSVDNPYGANGLLPHYLVLPEVLAGLRLVPDSDKLEVEGEIPGKGAVRATLRPVAANAVKLAPGRPPVWIARRDDPYWLERLPDGTLFVQYNDASVDAKDEPFAAFASRMERVARETPLERLVLDLRWNDGGSIRRARPMLHALIRLADLLPEGKLFVITSPHTFSAATLLATDVDLHTNALFVGEPTGGKPNTYGEGRRFKLPNSGIEIRHAAWYYQQSTPDDLRPAIFPDLVAELTAEDFANGEDPALRAIRAFAPRKPISDVVRARIASENVAAAMREYRELKATRFNEHLFDERELETVGKELLEKGDIPSAITVLGANAEEFVWSAQAHLLLGDAFAKAGRCAEARVLYETAFTYDKSFPTARDRFERLKACGAGK